MIKKILLTLLISLTLIGCSSTISNEVLVGSKLAYDDLISVESVKISDKKWGSGDVVDIVTTVKNNSDKVTHSVKIQINYLDNNDNVLNSQTKICLIPIEPGAVQEISIPDKKENIVKVSSKVVDVEFE